MQDLKFCAESEAAALAALEAAGMTMQHTPLGEDGEPGEPVTIPRTDGELEYSITVRGETTQHTGRYCINWIGALHRETGETTTVTDEETGEESQVPVMEELPGFHFDVRWFGSSHSVPGLEHLEIEVDNPLRGFF